MKYRFLLFFVVFLMSLSSCKTTSVMVPGEKKVRVQQMYSAYYSIAEEYFRLENYSKAIEFYEFAMKDRALHDAAYYKIGQCYAKNKQYDKAYSVFNTILRKDPENKSLKNTLAYLTAMNGNVEEAAELYY